MYSGNSQGRESVGDEVWGIGSSNTVHKVKESHFYFTLALLAAHAISVMIVWYLY